MNMCEIVLRQKSTENYTHYIEFVLHSCKYNFPHILSICLDCQKNPEEKVLFSAQVKMFQWRKSPEIPNANGECYDTFADHNVQ